MLEAISWATIGGLTPHALWMGAVVLIFTGKLHTNTAYKALEEQKRYWRETAEKLRETTYVQAKTIEKIEVPAETMVRVMRAVQEANNDRGGD